MLALLASMHAAGDGQWFVYGGSGELLDHDIDAARSASKCT
jgi:hypothetical protein